MEIMLSRVWSSRSPSGGEKFRLNKHNPQNHNFLLPVVHHKEERHMDWADLDLMVHPWDRVDRLEDMDRVLLVGNLGYIFLYFTKVKI